MFRPPSPDTPSQQAINCALEVYITAGKTDDTHRNAGLSALRHATEEQIMIATSFIQLSRQLSIGEMQERLAN